MNNKSKPIRRLLYICPSWEVWSSVINELEKKYFFKPIAVISHNSELMKKNIANKDCLFVDEKCFRIGGDYEKNDYALDEKILRKISPYKHITIKMMERYYYGQYSNNSDIQLKMYQNLVKYAYSMFVDCKPDIVVSASQPHRVFDYLIQQFCIVDNIRFVAYTHTNVIGLSYFNSPYGKGLSKSENFSSISDELQKLIQKTKSDNYEDVKPKNIGGNSFFSENNGNSTFFSSILKLFKLNTLFRPVVGRFIVLFRNGSLNTSYSNLLGLLIQKILKLLSLNILCIPYYSFFSKKNIYSEVDYIYFSPNFQPERTSVPDGGVFWDMITAIDMLHNALPPGWKILYKEHPRVFKKNSDWDIDRNIFYYLRLKLRHPNLIFIDKNENVLRIIDSAKVVSAITGSVVWESVIRGKPIILFGEHWHKNIPGVSQVKSLSECQIIMDKVSHKDFDIEDQEGLINCLAKLEDNCVDLRSYLYYAKEVRRNDSLNNGRTQHNKFNVDEITTKLVRAIIAAC